jgi:glycogen operon protein
MWIRPNGKEMTNAEWVDPKYHVIGILMQGDAAGVVDDRGHPLRGDTLLLLLNGGARARHFTLPAIKQAGAWKEAINTAQSEPREVKGSGVNLSAHSLILLAYASA